MLPFTKRFIVVLVILALLPRIALSKSYPLTSDIIGEMSYHIVNQEETLYSIAKQFDLGIVEVMAANPTVDTWLPKPGTLLFLPTMHVLPEVERKGIVINLSELRLFYFPGNQTVLTFPIGVGKEGWSTPLGQTKVTLKRKDPTWIPPPSIRAENPDLPAFIPPGPDNPMGAYALNIGLSGIAIHGTNKKYGIGLRSSHGCIRMYPEDIELLFKQVTVGTRVTIVDQPYKLGWLDDTLFLEVTPTQEQGDHILRRIIPQPVTLPNLYQDIVKKAGTEQNLLKRFIDRAAREHNGTPIPVYIKQ